VRRGPLAQWIEQVPSKYST